MSSIVYVVSNGCTLCGMGMSECSRGAISMTREGARIDPDKCVGCGRCARSCTFEAIARAAR